MNFKLRSPDTYPVKLLPLALRHSFEPLISPCLAVAALSSHSGEPTDASRNSLSGHEIQLHPPGFSPVKLIEPIFKVNCVFWCLLLFPCRAFRAFGIGCVPVSSRIFLLH
ncbi:hypothetical protein CSKR_202163 [Clonorchis sinensis]|uniref:Uncharacterized protein n=1 Tax=Clonorchis sinensis TaxID=79923 RepID=A0A8T1LVE5_CLOSI|nr:hypothetical protein CSKR_202163 [Clonorchis sinensis]